MVLKEEQLKEVAAIIGLSVEEVNTNSRYIDEIDAMYFWNPIKGGIAVIINKDGEKLAATSGINFEKHLEEFKNGRRN